MWCVLTYYCNVLLQRTTAFSISNLQGGATVLHAAASVGHVGIMEILMDKGLSPRAVDMVSNSNMSCQLYAWLLWKTSFFKIGLWYTIFIFNIVTVQQGDTPLHWIPGNGTVAAVRVLLDRGADVNAQNKVALGSSFTLSQFVCAVLNMLPNNLLCSFNTLPSYLLHCVIMRPLLLRCSMQALWLI